MELRAAKPDSAASPGSGSLSEYTLWGRARHVGIWWLALALRRFSSPPLLGCLPVALSPRAARPESSSSSSSVCPVHSLPQSKLQIQGVPSLYRAVAWDPASAPRSTVSCLGRSPRTTQGPRLGSKHPSSPPSAGTQPCSLPWLVSVSLTPARSPALAPVSPPSSPLGPRSGSCPSSRSGSGPSPGISLGAPFSAPRFSLRQPRLGFSLGPAPLCPAWSLLSGVCPQVRAALPGSAPRARLLPSGPALGSVRSRWG